MKYKNERSGKRRNAGFRFTAVVLLISMVLTLHPMPVHAGIFDDFGDWIGDKIDRLTQKTVGPFIKEGLSKIGLDAVYEKAEEAVKFAGDAAEGKLPMVDTIMDGLTNDVKKVANSAVSEISNVTEVLKELQDVGQQLYNLVASVPFNFDTEVNLPMPDGGNARVRAKKQDLAVDISFWLNGPAGTGIQAVFGLSNASPLGDGNAAHFANDGNTPTVFMDLTRNGRSYIHGRLPVVPGAFPYIIAEDYIALPNGQLIQVKVGALDESSISVEFGVSVEATCDYVVTASGGIGVSVGLEVNINHAQAVLTRGLYVLGDETCKIVEGGRELNIDNVAEALEQVLHEMDQYGRNHEDALGEATVGISLEAGLGAGVWDCTWNVLTLDTGLELVVPAAKIGSVVKETLSSLLQSGKTLAEITNIYSGYFLDYNIPNQVPAPIRNGIIDELEQGIPVVESRLKATADALIAAGIDTELDLYLSVDALGGKGQGVNMFGAEASIPLGGIVNATAAYLMPTIEGMSKVLGQLVSDGMVSYDNPPEWDGLAEVADDLAAGTRFRISVSTPLFVQLVLEAPGTPLLYAAGTCGELVHSALTCMANSAKSGSFAEFKATRALENLINAVNGLRDLTLGLQFTIGAYGEAGAEVYGGVGAGASISLNSNVEMFLLFANGAWDLPDYTGQANFSINGNVSAEGGISLGEGVEVKASGGVGLSTNFLSVTSTEYDDTVPPLLYSKAGSESANLQSLKLTAKGYDGTMQTFTSNYVKDSKHPLGGYYEIWAPSPASGMDYITLEATAFSSFAKVWIMRYGSSIVEGTGKAAVNYPLSSGTQVNCDVQIRSYDEKTTKTYPVVIKAAPNLQIKSLAMDKGSLRPEFKNPNITDYKLFLDCDTSEVAITPTLVENNRTVLEINGTNWSKDTPYTLRDIPYGESTLILKVRFPNSAADRRLKENTYRIRINRAKSANADLRSIELNRRELAENIYRPLSFSPGKTDYNVTVDPEVAGINVLAAVADNRASLRFGIGSRPTGNEPGLLSVDQLVLLQYGENKIYLETTAQNGTKKTYNLNITREKYQLNTLKVLVGGQEKTLAQGQTATRGFNPDVQDYMLRVPQGGSEIKLEFDTKLSGADIYYYDNIVQKYVNIGCNRPSYPRNGVYEFKTQSIRLPEGNDWEAKLVIAASGSYINGLV
ncbi:MAG: cadherin-like beta sandwich domain-containing protein [Bacillota bacterium]